MQKFANFVGMNTLLKMLLLAVPAVMSSCGTSDTSTAETTDSIAKTTDDRAFFELRDNVKEAAKTTYYDVKLRGDSVIIDTSAVNRSMSTVYFGKQGEYIAKRNEKVKRDEEGRIVRWEDHRPNAKGIHGGFLRDTLVYDHTAPNVMVVTGMGERSTIVRDDAGNIVGQYSTPLELGADVSAINVIKKTDDRGNWTERLTVWTVQAPGVPRSVNYTVDRREIKYYD